MSETPAKQATKKAAPAAAVAPAKKDAAKKKRKYHAPRNYYIAKGVPRYSKGVMYHKKRMWAMKNKIPSVRPSRKKVVAKKEEKAFQGGKRVVKKNKTRTHYELYKAPHPLNRRFKPKTAKLRSSIHPGQILILLAGRFKGKLVVFLKQLPSGLLLVTGPYCLNGVPMRRVNQAYVIATKTRLPQMDDVKISTKLNDEYFQKLKKSKKKSKTAKRFFQGKGGVAKEEKSRKQLRQEQRQKRRDLFKEKEAAKAAEGGAKAAAKPADDKKAEGKKGKQPKSLFVETQRRVDQVVMRRVKRVPIVYQYLRSKFTLRNGQFPHLMRF
jgi:large subunit ribosomal protein L6e